MREKFSWRGTRLAGILLILAFAAATLSIFQPRSSFLILPLVALSACANRNHSRYLRVDERGVRLMEENVGAKSLTRWHIEPRELQSLSKDGARLRLVTKTGRPRTINLAQTPFGGWRDPEELEAAIRERMAEAPAVIDSRPWSPETLKPTT